MKRLFYSGLILLGLFEILNVYFIMPLPGSQQMNTIDIAYFLFFYRWFFRIVFGLMILVGSVSAFKTKSRWIPAVAIIPVVFVIYVFNFEMTADHMFRQPETLLFHARSENTLEDSTLVIAVSLEHEAKAYPIRYIQYHHQIRDTFAGKPIMVTYCNVCRTGRVFEPLVDGKVENFRLVGMDHFNAMFEDVSTRSWWRQATGEAITGSLKGQVLPEVQSNQYTLNKFFSLHPFGKVMQAALQSKESYDTLGLFEKGKSKGKLTRRDSLSWNEKSWVLGVQSGKNAKAYDWENLKKAKVINDQVGTTPIVVALASDEQSFIALEREPNEQFILKNDSLISSMSKYDFQGRSITGSHGKVINSYQEYWHSWKQFHPHTEIHE